MANDEPPYLTVGTDVSAKYKGAFCEAKIKKVNRVVKCKVTFKNNQGSFMVTDDLVKGTLRMGADIEAKHPEKNQFLDAVINKMQDYSQYTVVFDDGDETTLRRTSLCLKSGRHFAESPTLDQFPLTNPEHFGTPVIGTGKFKRKRRSTMNSSLDYESSDDDPFPRKLKAIKKKERDPDLGKVVAVDYGDRRKKDSWYPGLIVPHPAQSTIKISKEEHLIRSFKDGKYYQVPKRDTREFQKDNLPKIENNALKTAVDKAVQYLEKDELPSNWEKSLFMGLEHPSADEDSQDFDSDTSDDEPSEDKDRFVAQLYKFMDERGTPINKAPSVSNKDLNLYKLFKLMHKLGGFNKVTNQNKWKIVYTKMGLPQSNANGPNQIKGAYKRYLQSFEDFYRKLGCTMVNNSRSTRGRHRSDRNFILTRTRERADTSSPKGRNSKDTKDKGTPDKKPEDKPRVIDKKEIKVEDSPKPESKSPEKKKVEKIRSEEKDERQKKEERPRLVRSQSLNKEKRISNPKEEDKKDAKPEKARTREDARKEKNESPEKKGTRSSLKIEMEKKEKEETLKDKKDLSPNKKEKKEEKLLKDVKEEKVKDKKDDKILKERKVIKEKKLEDKSVKDKVESLPEKKKEEKQLREKRDSSKEPKEEKPMKGRKEETKNPTEEKSPPKKKLERLVKEKKEEKLFRPRRENKSPLPENKKNVDEVDVKIVKEEKIKIEFESKKDDFSKEKPGPKLRDRQEGALFSEDDDIKADASDDKDTGSQDGFEKKGPGARSKEELDEVAPNKAKKRSLKPHNLEKDLEDALTDSDDEIFASEQDKDSFKDLKNCEIELGDRVKVKYGRGRLKKVYDAKVLKMQADGTEKRYFVHYNGWNNRYDEWVKRNFIVALVNPTKQGKDASQKTSSQTLKRIDRGRPPGPIVSSKPARKNSTSSTNSSLSCSRATRSDKKSLQYSPLSSGLEPKKRTRKKSGVVGLTDTSQDSDSDVDLDDDDVGDADVEDNGNTLNDSCFKEELFSDDEEKEKLEDVKRDDITELEKAISVEEPTEDDRDTFFSPVKTEANKPEKPVKEEYSKLSDVPQKIKEISVEQPLKECTTTDVKPENENKQASMLNSPAVKIIEKESEAPQTKKTPEEEKKVVPETSVIANVNKNVIIPTKVLPIFSSLSEVKCEKPVLSPNLPKVSPLLAAEPNKKDILEPIFTPSTVSPPENRNLSFAGLHGLIQINTFERASSSCKNIAKDTPTKMEPSKVILSSSPPKIDLKPIETKSISPSLYRSDKIMPLFGSNSMLNPPKLMEPVKNNDKPVLKNSIFSFATKSNEEKDQKKDLKLLELPFTLSAKNTSKEKLEQKSENFKITKPSDSADKKSEPSFFKRCILSPPKISAAKIENIDLKSEKVKDDFDLLVERTSAPKKPEVKESIFSLSFSNVVPKEKFHPEQPYNKMLALSADNLCIIKPKPTETFDLSKTIPSILERLKKDEVADIKGTDSPPPQREELNFNFLRSSQDTAKSLSRSESSNSLRICEDLSDTNDSNTDSKDLVIGDKLCTPSVESCSASDNAVCSSETLVSLPEATKSETSVVDSIPSSGSVTENKEDVKISLKTSVITVASIKMTPVPVTVSEVKKDAAETSKPEKDNISKEIEKKIEFPPVEQEEATKSQADAEVTESKAESQVVLKPVPIIGKELRSESSTESNNEESSNQSKFEKSYSNNNNSEKDSLFDDLLKIKSTNTNFSQSSVIMWNTDTKVNVAIEDKKSVPLEDKDTSVKEEVQVHQEVGQALTETEVSTEISPNEKNASDKDKDVELSSNNLPEIKSEPEDIENPEDDGGSTSVSKKEGKKKRFGKKLKKFGNSEGFEDKDSKFKDGKSKSKKRRLEGEESRDPDLKSKSKKIKKSKNKKRLAKHDDLQDDQHKKADTEEDHKDIAEKIKRKEKRKNDKKFLKSGMKGEFSESKLELKKKKGKKNRDKLSGEKKDFLEKKTKKKKKPHIEENQDTDSDKEMSHNNKSVERKKKKDKKKFKTKDSSSSDDAGEKFFKEQSKTLSSSALLRQDSKSDDPDMSFLLCEEKVPASPVGISNMADDTSGSSSIEENRINSTINILPLPIVYPCLDNIESSDAVNKHSIDTSAVLDNTPPTTPSSTESLLSSSSPSHERDSFSINYPESTQSGRESAEGESDVFRCNSNRTISHGSEEYHAATTLAFAVCKSSVSEKPKEEPSHNFLKRQKSEVDEHSPSKRRKKSKRVRRCSESAKSPRHKSSLSRLSKIESCCEDSSGASPATSSSPPYSNTSISFSRSPHRISCSSEGIQKINYVPLHEKDPEKRIAILQEKMAALRKEYMELRAKVIAIDHKRRRARKKVREAGAVHVNPSAQSEDGQSCS